MIERISRPPAAGQRGNLSRLLSLLAVFAMAFPASLLADRITLKSGATVEGTIVTQNGVEVRIKVQGPSITAEPEIRVIKRIDISHVDRTPLDQRDFAELQKFFPIPDRYQRYDYLIEVKLKGFLKRHPNSTLRDQVNGLLRQAREERARFKKGYAKVAGKWIRPDDSGSQADEFKAREILTEIRSQTKAGESLAALSAFERLENDFQGTQAYAEAVAPAKKALGALARDLARERQHNRDLTREHIKTLRAAADRIKVLTGFTQKQAPFVNKRKAAAARGAKWLPINPYDLSTIEEAEKMLQEERARLARFDAAAHLETVKAFAVVQDRIGEKKWAEAGKTLAGIKPPESMKEYVARLQSRIRTAAEADPSASGMREADGEIAAPTSSKSIFTTMIALIIAIVVVFGIILAIVLVNKNKKP